MSLPNQPLADPIARRLAMIERERDALEGIATRLMAMLEHLDDEQSRLQARRASKRPNAPPEPVAPVAGEIVDETTAGVPRRLDTGAFGRVRPVLIIEDNSPIPKPIPTTKTRPLYHPLPLPPPPMVGTRLGIVGVPPPPPRPAPHHDTAPIACR